MRKRFGPAAVPALILALLLAWGGPAHAQDPWKVGTWKTAQTIQPFFYQQFLPAQPVKVFPFTNPADQKMALLAGSLDLCGTTLAHAIHAASRGEPVVVVAALCNKCSALVVKKDGPIQSIKDLAGKKIGYVPGTMHEILLREALTKNGINPNRDVKLVRVDFFDMGLALARGSIDAFLSGEPFPTLAVLEGYGRILAYPYYGGGIGTINAGMLVKRDTIAKSPDKVAALVRAQRPGHPVAPGPPRPVAAKGGELRHPRSRCSPRPPPTWSWPGTWTGSSSSGWPPWAGA